MVKLVLSNTYFPKTYLEKRHKILFHLGIVKSQNFSKFYDEEKIFHLEELTKKQTRLFSTQKCQQS